MSPARRMGTKTWRTYAPKTSVSAGPSTAMQAVEPTGVPQSAWSCSNGPEGLCRAPVGLWEPVRTAESGSFWHPTHPKRSTWPGRSCLGAGARAGAPARCPDRLVHWPGVSFFICQPQLLQCVMDGGQAAVQVRSGTQFAEGQIRFSPQQLLHLTPVRG